jgi:hypothetical protein
MKTVISIAVSLAFSLAAVAQVPVVIGLSNLVNRPIPVNRMPVQPLVDVIENGVVLRFVADPTNTLATNRFLVGTNAVGRWKHVWNGDPQAFGADPLGINDSTSAISNAVNSGRSVVTLPIGTFLIDPITIPPGVTLVGVKDSILKARSWPTSNTKLITLSSDSTIDGFTVDGNRAGLTEARGTITNFNFVLFRPVSAEYVANATVKNMTFTNTFFEPVWAQHTTNFSLLDCDFVDISKGPMIIRSTRPLVRNITLRDSMFNVPGNYQHGLNSWFNTNAVMSQVLFKNIGGSNAGFTSSQLQAFILSGDVHGKYSGFHCSGVHPSNASLPTAFALDGAIGSTFENFTSVGWGGGPQWEMNSMVGNTIIGGKLDGSIIPPGGTVSANLGIFFRDDGVNGSLGPTYQDVQIRDRTYSHDNLIDGLVVVSCGTGIEVGGSNNQFVNCRSTGNAINGLRIWSRVASIAALQYTERPPTDTTGNTFYNCVFDYNYIGAAVYGGERTEFINCKFNDNGQGTAGFGLAALPRFRLQVASATSNTVTFATSPFTESVRFLQAYIETNGTSQIGLTPHVVTSWSPNSLTVSPNWTDGLTNLTLTTSDYINIYEPVSTSNAARFWNCEFSDHQNWTDVDGASFDPSAVGSNLTNLTVVGVRNGHRINLNQRILLKGVATGGSSTNVIVQVLGYVNGATIDLLRVFPISLGDGTALSTATVNVPLKPVTGTVTGIAGNYGYYADPVPLSPQFMTLTGSGTRFGYDLDFYLWVKRGSEYRRLWRQSTSTLAYVFPTFSSDFAGASLERVVFDVSGVPSQFAGVWAQRFPGKFTFRDSTWTGNTSVSTNSFLSQPFTINTFDVLSADAFTATSVRASSMVVETTSAAKVLTLQRAGAITNTFDFGGSQLNWVNPNRTIMTDSQSASANKASRIGSGTYASGTTGFGMLFGNAVSNANSLAIGGGSSGMDASTTVTFWGAGSVGVNTGTNIAAFIHPYSLTTNGVSTNTSLWLLDGTSSSIKRVFTSTNSSAMPGFKLLMIAD